MTDYLTRTIEIARGAQRDKTLWWDQDSLLLSGFGSDNDGDIEHITHNSPDRIIEMCEALRLVHDALVKTRRLIPMWNKDLTERLDTGHDDAIKAIENLGGGK